MGISFAQNRGLVAVLAECLLGAVASWAHADPCSRAREEYERGKDLKTFEERRDAFQKAVDLCPTFAEAHVNLADAYENLAIKRRPDDPQHKVYLDLAEKHYQEAIRLNPKLWHPYVGLGDVYIKRGQFPIAKQALERALSLNPTEERILGRLQWLEAKLSSERDGYKTAKEIVAAVKESKEADEFRTLQILERTDVRDRQRFINIIFDEWSDKLNRKETIQQLNEIGEALASEELANFTFVVEGHTDPRGGLERNQKLSLDRANAVKRYLIEKFKIDPSRITTEGLWYSRPRFPNNSSENMRKNRRVELLFIDNQAGR